MCTFSLCTQASPASALTQLLCSPKCSPHRLAPQPSSKMSSLPIRVHHVACTDVCTLQQPSHHARSARGWAAFSLHLTGVLVQVFGCTAGTARDTRVQQHTNTPLVPKPPWCQHPLVSPTPHPHTGLQPSQHPSFYPTWKNTNHAVGAILAFTTTLGVHTACSCVGSSRRSMSGGGKKPGATQPL